MFRRIIILFIPIFLIIGCQDTTDDAALNEKKTPNQEINVENTSRKKDNNFSNREIADHLGEVANSVSDVNDAVAIVAGPYAVIGLDLDSKLDRSRVGTIKYSVLEALQKDPYGKTAVVVADGDITERIKSMNNQIQQGYPVQGVVEELAGIVARYMPNFPVPEQGPVEPDKNKEQLPKDKEQKLDDIQEEQSNENNN